jgi:phospholipase/carboxylesterase
VILAHGYGSNGQDLIGLAPYLAQALPDAAFVSPNAPEPVPGYPGGHQWFPISRLDPQLMAAGVRGARAHLDGFIDAELARHGLPASACALVASLEGLGEAGVPALWRISEGTGHSVAEDGLALGAAFLRDALGGAFEGWTAPVRRSRAPS